MDFARTNFLSFGFRYSFVIRHLSFVIFFVKPKLAALLIVLGFGALKMPFEQRLDDEHRKAFFHGAKLSLDLRQQIGQMAFLAALSGFRSVVADFLFIEAHTAWEHVEWGTVALLLNQVVSLEPRNVTYWDTAAWHMAWNASVAARYDKKEPREALRIKREREYFKLGEDFALRGIQNNPDRYNLYERLGTIYRDKLKDHCKAADAFDLAAKAEKAPTYEKRMAAYELAQCDERQREAYEKLRALYEMGDRERLPSVIKWLNILQEKLNIPAAERLKLPEQTK